MAVQGGGQSAHASSHDTVHVYLNIHETTIKHYIVRTRLPSVFDITALADRNLAGPVVWVHIAQAARMTPRLSNRD